MIKSFNIQSSINKKNINSILKTWNSDEIKIIHLKSNMPGDNLRDFYETIGKKIGKFCKFAEDVNLGSRSKQRSGKIWMDVRYDANIKNAYRHSSNPQPLHTDGSYIPKYPNATLMCCISNSAIGGETTFVDPELLAKVIKKENPTLLNFLLQTPIIHERSGDKKKKKILEVKNGKYKVNWNYYCVSKKNPKKVLKLVENFFNYLNESKKIKKITKKIKLNPGHAVFWKDSEVLHGRNGFVANRNSERFLWKCAIEIGK
jgi:alpha-ketoglutarate-dependent taurine dioxygenase